ncbi:aspartic proteinase 36-like isoform X2 [Aristolochia californica]|uniref:aspartic proteinase 36-like isoform X2 n=1 Tax=Aristolochia californica TaxID=171875 RepID=UPI0035E2A4A0
MPNSRACVQIFFFLIALLADDPLAAARSDPNKSNASLPTGLAMILPLVLSVPNSSRLSTRQDFHRQLRKDSSQKPNARMRLHDDLLTNGYYTTRLWIGTPPQEFALIVDSGSTVTYVPCSDCEQCGNHQDPRFQPELSSTYQKVMCNIDCTCDDLRKVCIYERQYAEQSSSSGVLGNDIISFGKESALGPQRAVFGCENAETGDLFSQHADGIIGLGSGPLSIMDQLVQKGVISDSFSLCYGGMDVGGGAMVLGGISPPPDMVFSRSDPVRSPYYNIELKELHVGGAPLPLPPKVFDGKHGTVLDSGTTYAYLPEAAFVAFRDAIIKNLHNLKQIRGPDPNYNDICFSGAGSDPSQLSKSFPKVEMVFSNGHKMLLTPENYLFRHSKVRGGYCLGVFQNGKDPTTLLGGIIVRNTLVTYDRQNQRIGFWNTNCSELWERLHMTTAPSPAPTSSISRNSALDGSPALPPAVLPDGEFRVGVITFEISSDVKYSDLVPQVTKLAEYIAQELEVNTYQVKLLNFTSEGNGTLLRCGVFPAGSSNYISNTTAKKIISRLTQHNVHLPDSFGSYQLVKWKIEPPQSRSWWQKHFLSVVVGLLVAVLLSSSTFLVRYIWRHRQAVGRYEAVNAASPEQELQQL